jgi:hypothetical protein
LHRLHRNIRGDPGVRGAREVGAARFNVPSSKLNVRKDLEP